MRLSKKFFDVSGNRVTSIEKTFNEWLILANTQEIYYA